MNEMRKLMEMVEMTESENSQPIIEGLARILIEAIRANDIDIRYFGSDEYFDVRDEAWQPLLDAAQDLAEAHHTQANTTR